MNCKEDKFQMYCSQKTRKLLDLYFLHHTSYMGTWRLLQQVEADMMEHPHHPCPLPLLLLTFSHSVTSTTTKPLYMKWPRKLARWRVTMSYSA